MWLSVSGILVLFLYVNPTVSKDVCSDGMMKEAILSLARIIRDNSLRIERHEARDRQNSDYVRKAVDDLTKKVSVVDTFITHFSKIEDQISEIEQLMTQRDERERIQMQKTTDSIQNLESRLESRFDEIKNTISEVSRRAVPTQAAPTPESVSPSDIISKLNDTEAHLVLRIAQIQSSLDTMAIENKAEARKQETAYTERNESERIQDERTETLILNLESRLKTRLDQINNTINEVNDRVAPSPTTESVSASDIMSKLNDTEVHFLEKVEQIQSKLNTMDTKNTEEAATQARKLQTASTERNERERIQEEKTKTLILNLENRLETRLDEISNTINEVNDRVEATPPPPTTESVSASDIIDKLNVTEVHFLEKVGQIQSKLDTMDIENRGEGSTQAEKLQTVFTEVHNISARLSDIASLLEGIEEAAKEDRAKPEEPKVDIGAIIQAQSREIKKVSDLVEDTINLTQNLPKISDIQAMHNETQTEIQEAKYDLQTAIVEEIKRIINNFSESNNQIEHSIIDLRSDLANNTQSVNEELHDIAKASKSVHGVVVSMGDELMDTKRKLEYALQQILSRVDEAIKNHNTEINNTLNDKFNETVNNIINNQNSAVAIVKNAMTQESETVWRQMMVMNNQLFQNGIILDKINHQNEAYVADTTSTMDGMGSKVGEIKKRMTDMERNLNYLLGRLSLVTRQFDQIKIGLGAALDEVKASFKEIQEKADILNHAERHPEPYSGLIAAN